MAETNGSFPRWSLYASLASAAIALAFLVWTAFDRLQTAVSEERERTAAVCADLVEIETQFRADDEVRNLMHANDLRIEGLLWRKVYGEDYPAATNPYLPTIAQEQPTPCR